jgi:hypothetical protein
LEGDLNGVDYFSSSFVGHNKRLFNKFNFGFTGNSIRGNSRGITKLFDITQVARL